MNDSICVLKGERLADRQWESVRLQDAGGFRRQPSSTAGQERASAHVRFEASRGVVLNRLPSVWVDWIPWTELEERPEPFGSGRLGLNGLSVDQASFGVGRTRVLRIANPTAPRPNSNMAHVPASGTAVTPWIVPLIIRSLWSAKLSSEAWDRTYTLLRCGGIHKPVRYRLFQSCRDIEFARHWFFRDIGHAAGSRVSSGAQPRSAGAHTRHRQNLSSRVRPQPAVRE